jgi:hypothetical protein
MDWWPRHLAFSLLVIIHNLDVGRFQSPFWPLEADSPLVVDANAELPSSISTKRLKSVARHHHEILDRPC